MKLVLKLAAVLVALVLIAAVAGVFYIDNIATAGLKKAAAYATETEADCDKVDVQITGGAVSISNLDIKNPKGFQEVHESFMVLHDGSTKVALGTLRSDEIEIEHVTLDGIDISLVGRDGETNYQTIIESITRFSGDEPAQPAEEGGKTFVIRNVTIKNIRVHVDLDEDPVLGLVAVKWEEPLVIDEIVLTDVGGDGVPMEQITADLIQDIMLQVVARFGDQLGGFAFDLTGQFANSLGLDALQGQFAELGLDSFDLEENLAGFSAIGGEMTEDLRAQALEAFPDFDDLAGDIGQEIDAARDNLSNIINEGIDGIGGGDGGSPLDNIGGRLLGGDDED